MFDNCAFECGACKNILFSRFLGCILSRLIWPLQLWDVVRRMIVYAYKTYDKAAQPDAPGIIIRATVAMLGALDCYIAL